MTTRKFTTQLLLYWLAVLCCGSKPIAAQQTLRQAAQSSGVLIGTAVRPVRLSESAYATTLAREYNLVEPEDALKWEILRPDPQSFDFDQGDQLIAFAAQHNLKVRGHTLVWHRQNPAWLMEGHYSPEQLSNLLETHIRTVVGHYRGKIFAWDVANEAFDEGRRAGDLRSTIWYNQPGIGYAQERYSYLAQCFRWAHQADPAALLFYNDAEAEEINPKSDAIYAMVREFQRLHVPINGVGLQMHISDLHPNIASISDNIARFTALGVQVHITEMDVSLPVDANGNARTEDLQHEADIYRQIASVCLSHPLCTAIQTWGFTDKYSWIGSHSKGARGAALPFDRNYQAKPAYNALREQLSKAH